MKKYLIHFSGLLSVCLLCAVVLLSTTMRSQSPVIFDMYDAANRHAELFMDAVCSGDYAAAEALLDGTCKLSSEAEHSNAFYQTLWDAYIDSLSYQFTDSCYTNNYGVYRDVTVTFLDIPHLMSDLQSRIFYTTTSEDHVMESLAESAINMIAEREYNTTETLTLQLVSRNGQWLILPSPQLIDFMQGSMGGT